MVVVGAYRQRAELRKNLRRQLRHRAMIHLGAEAKPIPCTLHDASQSGARIVLESEAELPEYFTLLLSANGGARRRCRVVWRNEREVGVQFFAGLSPAERAPKQS